MTSRSSSRIRLGAYAAPAMRGAVLAGAVVTLSGCDSDQTYVPEPTAAYEQQLAGSGDVSSEVVAYKTVDECVAGGNDRAVCDSALENAKQSGGRFAPRYDSLEDCQKDFDKCETSPDAQTSGSYSHGNSWQPFINGFLIAHALDGYGSRSGYQDYAPIFRTRDGSLVNGAGRGIPSYGSYYPADSRATHDLTQPPSTIQRFGLGQSQTTTRGTVTGSASDTVRAFRSSPDYASAKGSTGFRSQYGGGSKASYSSRASGGDFSFHAGSSVSRGGFGSSGHASFGG